MCLEHPLSMYHWHLLIVDLFTCNQEGFIDYGTQFWVGPVRSVTFRNPLLPFSHRDRVGFIDSIDIRNCMVSFSRSMRRSWSKRSLWHINLFEFLLLLWSLKFSSSSLFSSSNWIGWHLVGCISIFVHEICWRFWCCQSLDLPFLLHLLFHLLQSLLWVLHMICNW